MRPRRTTSAGFVGVRAWGLLDYYETENRDGISAWAIARPRDLERALAIEPRNAVLKHQLDALKGARPR